MRAFKVIKAAILVLFSLCLTEVYAQVTIYSQDFGDGSGCVGDWTRSPMAFINCGNTNASSGYTGATGSGNVELINGSIGTNVSYTFSGVSTVGYTDINVLWGARKSAGTQPTYNASWSTNGTDWTSITFTDVANNDTWALVNSGTAISLPAGAAGQSNLQIRISYTTVSTASRTYMIDDFTIEGTCSEPTTNATSPSTFNLSPTQSGIQWTNGNGFKRIVIMREAAAVSFSPVDATTYSANSDFSAATDLGSGNKCVFNGTSSNVEVTGLNSATTYHITVFEYGCGTGNENYLLTSALTYNFTTCPGTEPSTQPSSIVIDNAKATEVDISWTNGNGSNRLLALSVASPDGSPTDGQVYSPDLIFDNGQDVIDAGLDEFVMETGAVSSAVCTSLSPGTTYYYQIFEFDCPTIPDYLVTSPAAGNFTTCGEPAGAPNTDVVSNITASGAQIDWAMAGGSTNSIVVVKATSAVLGTPADLSIYSANAAFGTGGTIAANEYVVYNSTGTSVAITSLLPGTTYHYAIFSFNDCGGEPQYYTTASEIGSFNTCVEPSNDPTANTVSSISSSGATIGWALGIDATNTLLVVRESSAVSGLPSDATTYASDLIFNNGQDFIAAGEYVMYTSTGTSAAITGLTANTTYHYALFGFNDCGANPQYDGTTAAIGSFTTCDGIEPTSDATAPLTSNVTSSQIQFDWSNGNGEERIVVARQGSAVSANPVDGSVYSADAAFGSGQDIGANEFIVYKGTGSSVVVTALTTNTQYFFKIFEYNCVGSPNYYTSGTPLETNETTCSGTEPTVESSAILTSNISDVQIQFDWTVGDGDERLVVIRQGSAVSANPIDGTTYTDNAAFGSGSDLGTSEFVVYKGAGNSIVVTGLTANTQYFIKVFEYNCSSVPNYFTSGTPASDDETTCTGSAPTVQTTAESVTNISSVSADFSWTIGDGAARILVMSTSAIAGTPADGTTYTANAAFGSGGTIVAGEYVVYNNTGTSISVTNLTANTQYFYAFYELNCVGSPDYLSPPLTGNFTTCAAPTQDPTAVTVSNIYETTADFAWTIGADADNTILLLKSGSAVDSSPIDGTTYTADLNFSGTPSQIGVGNFVLFSGSDGAANITGLTQNTTYHYSLISYDICDGDPTYKTSGVTGNFTTCSSSAPSSNTSISSIDNSAATSLSFSLNAGNGTNRLVVLSTTAIVGSPVDGTDYTANTIFGSGNTIAAGEYVVYDGTGTIFSVTNLTAGTEYFYALYEYNCELDPKYMTAVTGSVTTCGKPTTAASGAAASLITAETATLSWTVGDGSNSLVVIKPASAVTATPVDLSIYTASTAFRSGTDISGGDSTYVMYNSTGTSVSMTNLDPSTTYHFTIFSFNNCSSQPQYLTVSTHSGSFTTSDLIRSISGADLSVIAGWETDNDNNAATNPFVGTFADNDADFYVNDAGSGVSNSGNLSITGTNSRFVIRTASDYTSTATSSLTASVTIEGTGTLNIDNASSPTLTSLSTTSTVTYGGSATTVVSTTYANLTIDDAPVTLGGAVTVNAALTINNPLTIGANTLTANAGISGTSYLVGSSASNLTLSGSGNITALNFSTTAGEDEIQNLILSRGASNVITLGSDLTVSGNLTLTSGILAIGTNMLTLDGATTSYTSGAIRGSTTSDLTIGPGVITGTLNMNTTSVANRTVATLDIQANTTLGSNIIVGTNLNMNGGDLTIGANTLTLDGNYTTAIAGSQLVGSSSSVISVAGAGAMTNSLELDQTTLGTTNALSSLTVNRASQTITLGTNLSLSGSLTVSAGVFNNGGNVISNGGSSSLSVSNSAEIELGGTTDLSGFATKTFGRTSTAEYKGSNQTVTNASYGNLTITNSGTAALDATGATLYSDLKVNSLATLDLGGFNLIMISDASGTAAILDVDGTLINGTNVTVRRYIDGIDGWRLLASPVNDAVIEDWNDDFSMSGFTGTNAPAFSFTSVYTWNEATGAADYNTGWIEPTNTTDGIPYSADASALAVYIAGDELSDLPKTVDVNGTIVTGDVTISNLSLNAGTYGGWHLIGNPYAAPVDWATVSKTNIANGGEIYLEDASGNFFTSSILTGGTLSSSEGGWVQVSNGTNSIGFTENSKEASPTTDSYNLKLSTDNLPMVNIIVSVSGHTDKAFMKFNDEATMAYDVDLDARKMDNMGGKTNVGVISSDNENLLINTLPLTLNEIIPIKIYRKYYSNITQTYNLSFENIDDLLEHNKCFVLEDRKTGSFIPLTGDYTHTFTMKDTTKAPRFFLHVSSPLEVNTTDISCYGANAGKISAYAPEGTNYDFVWKNQAGDVISTSNGVASADSLEGLSPGYYTVEVSGLAGSCSSVTQKYLVEAPSEIVVEESVSELSCAGNGSDASISVNASGGQGTLTYEWEGFGAAQSISNLSAGDYSLTITDENSCEKVMTYSIASPIYVTITESIKADDCAEATGAITIMGEDDYSYVWSNGANTHSISDLEGGVYSVTVANSDGCVATETFTVASNPNTIAVTEAISNTNCGLSLGEISVSSSEAYSYNWSNGDATSSISNLTEGEYSVTVNNDLGCNSVFTYQITDENNPVIVTETSKNPNCIDEMNGEIILAISGGSDFYTVEWSNGSDNTIIDGLAVGTYEVTVTDSQGCSATESYTLSTANVNNIEVTESIENSTCGSNTGAVETSANGTYSYLWSNGSTSTSISNLTSGNYVLSVSDQNNCFKTYQYNVSDNNNDLALTESITDVACFGESNGSINLSLTGGTGFYQYQWSNGTSSEDLVNVTAGTYEVTATDANGCYLTASYQLTEPLEITASFSVVIPLGSESPVSFTNESNNGVTYLWNFGDGNFSNEESTTHTYANAGNYNVELTAYSGNCESSVTQSIAVPPATGINDVENEFVTIRQNGDQISIVLNFPSTEKADIKVLNGLGQVVYSKSNVNSKQNAVDFTLDASAAVYFVEVSVGNEQIKKKIFVK